MCCGDGCCHQRSMHDIKCRCCCDRCVKCDVCAGEDVEDFAGDILTSAVFSHLAGQIFRPKRPSRNNPFLNIPDEEVRRSRKAACEEDYFLYEPEEPETPSPASPSLYSAGCASAYSISGVTTTSVQRLDSTGSESTGRSLAALATSVSEARKSAEATGGNQKQGSRRGKNEYMGEDTEEVLVDVREGPAWEEGYIEGHLRRKGTIYHGGDSDDEEPLQPRYSTGMVWSINNACSHM